MRMKLAGRDSCGKIPKVFLDNDIVKMEFDIHDFANREEQRDEYFYTGTIKAHGHLWKLKVLPRGMQYFDNEAVCIDLVYAGENVSTDPVVTQACIRTQTDSEEIPRHEISKYAFSKELNSNAFSCHNIATREDLIENDCNEAGTLTITVELQVATEQKSVWYPQLTHSSDDIGTLLYNSPETSDITFIIGASKKEFFGHKCVLSVRARVWYDLVLTEASSSSSENNNNICIVLADVDETAFEVLLTFVYYGVVPTFNDDDDEEELAKLILLVANRFGVTELKLYAESILVEYFLVPSNAAALLLFADAYICPLLKEVAMDTYMTDSTTFMNAEDDWNKLQESSKLLTELLVYTNNERTRDSSAVVVDDVDDLDVTSLRERLQRINLDVDGSREMLVQRWKETESTLT